MGHYWSEVRGDALTPKEKRKEEKKARQLKWDRYFLNLAQEISKPSKDPSTKCGAIIVNPDRRIISTGYNGFPRGCRDDKELYDNRPVKYLRVVHCEVNAIIFAKQDLSGCTLYTWPFSSCARCTGIVINAGITRCVAPPATPEILTRWGDDIKLSLEMYAEAGVQVDLVDIVDVV